MRTSFLIFYNKLITLVCKLFGKKASVFPGSLVLPFDRNVLDKIKYPKYVIGVTGSSGKGTTVALIAHILKENGLEVIWNESGSNAINATTTIVLNNTKILSHQMKCDVLLLEIDEIHLKETSILTHLIVTNVTRDQVARNSTPEMVLNKIKEGINDQMHLIINADDPLVMRLAIDFKGKITTYGIAETEYSRKKPISNNIDAAYCPICSKKLKYDYYHYGHLGNYHCPECDFKRKTDYETTNIDLDNAKIMINKETIHLNKNAFFNIYSTTAAYTLTNEMGINKEAILKALNINILPSKRLKTLKFGERDINMLESKNENNLSYYQSLDFINNYPDKKTVILGFDNVSRRYSYNDISWLYDVDFEHLDTKNIDYIYCIGKFKYDVYTRLVHAGINEKQLILVDEIKNIKSLLNKSKGTIFTMVCFDMTEILKKVLLGD